MDIRQFEYIDAIAHEFSLSRAAERLHISAPTLSQFLSRLEHELGIVLFFRNRSGVVPTEAGLVYLEGAKSILRVQAETLERLARLKESPGSVVRIGVCPGRSAGLFTDFLPDFSHRHPEVEIRMVEAPMPALDALIRSGAVDFALATLHHDEPLFSGEVLYRGEIVLAMATQHLALSTLTCRGDRTLSVADLTLLSGEKFIIGQPGYRLRAVADRYFEAAGFEPRQLMEATEIDLVCRLLERGMGVGFVPRDIANQYAGLATFSLEPQVGWEFGVQYLRGREPRFGGRLFVTEMRQYLLNLHEGDVGQDF